MSTPRLKETYNEKVAPALKEKLGMANVMQVPRFEKIVVNMGVGEAVADRRQIESAMDELSLITGQKPRLNKSRRSVAGFKVREGMPVGASVTLRGNRMWEFFDRLLAVSIPRIRDFRGLNPRSFDGRGNYTFGVTEQLIFPEIDFDRVSSVRGMDITICTSANEDAHAKALLEAFGFPFRTQQEAAPMQATGRRRS
ncbi:MAG: 50S ribosomal protein L5 [Acidimicrobiia bacterium]|nr:50S ribosomal protein L5 [Acidimicrobiia bacterium]MDQ3499462.1 50S ribosomal protein L5 [Actinomycetota bacterium]